MPLTPRLQSGAATLAITLLLLIATSIMSFALARNGLLEQRILHNELWGTEAFHRAEALLEQAMHELQYQDPATLGWQAGEPGWEVASLAVPDLSLPEAVSAEGYSLALDLRRRAAYPEWLEVMARAQGSSGSGARLRQYVRVEANGAGPAPWRVTRLPGSWRDF